MVTDSLNGQVVPILSGRTPFDPAWYVDQNIKREIAEFPLSSRLFSYQELMGFVTSQEMVAKEQLNNLDFLVSLLKIDLFDADGEFKEYDGVQTAQLIEGKIRTESDLTDTLKFVNYHGILDLPPISQVVIQDSLSYAQKFKEKIYQFMATVSLDRLKRDDEAKVIVGILNESGILGLLWKGTKPYNLYCYRDTKVTRSSGDLDVLIHPIDSATRKRLEEQLDAHNLKIDSESKSEMVIKTKDGKRKVAELRSVIFEEKFQTIPKSLSFWNLYRDRRQIADPDEFKYEVLCPNDQYKTLALHCIKHGSDRLKLIADVAMMIKNTDRENMPDWEEIIQYAQENNLELPMIAIPVLSDMLFGVGLPKPITDLIEQNPELVAQLNQLAILTLQNLCTYSSDGVPQDDYVRATQIPVHQGPIKAMVNVLTVPEVDKPDKKCTVLGVDWVIGELNRTKRVVRRDGLLKSVGVVINRFLQASK